MDGWFKAVDARDGKLHDGARKRRCLGCRTPAEQRGGDRQGVTNRHVCHFARHSAQSRE
jgi:hypothetical protein